MTYKIYLNGDEVELIEPSKEELIHMLAKYPAISDNTFVNNIYTKAICVPKNIDASLI